MNRLYFNRTRYDRLALALVVGALSFAGCAGEDGIAGAVGPAGADGKDGADGADGADGKDGNDGDTGAAGPAGADGGDGATGATGVVGPDGTDGMDAVLGPVVLLNGRTYGWLDDNRAAINAMITDLGSSSPDYDPEFRPVAVFDWDNTVIKNDIGDQTMAYLIENDKVLQPPGKDWAVTNENLTAEAKASLNAACDDLAAEGEPLPTSGDADCAAAIFSIYYDGVVAGSDQAAWQNGKTYTINQPYAWVAQLLSGYSPASVRQFANAAFDRALSEPEGATKTVGGISMAAYIRVYEPMADLAAALQRNGFDVWVVTASPQNVVDGIANEVGVDADHVIGIRNVLEGGLLTYGFQGCGTVADDNRTMITFDRGKRCWINKVIFGLDAADQEAQAADPANRPVFVAGDSDTDIAMLKDATHLKLVINRNKTEAMCNAYANYDSKWFVQPMFIEPKAQRTAGYACSTATDHEGNAIVDEAGASIADQDDSVYALP
ncbi:MAG: haloacid dehalogenase-like hydrolase [Myxococcales bacterium]|nr:haloacid dehalogenase-like hydrolase [Myxococcales bacterium]